MNENKPFNQGHLKVSDLHSIYFHEYGNPEGKAILAPHGGPGSSSKAKYAKLYDLNDFRVVLYDQRGCGKSTPFGELKDNTTQDLIDDIEKLRKYLGIERWYMYGPSWGSTLALLYAEKFPERVEKMVLRGIFFGSKREDDWLFQFGANQVFPERWEKFMNKIPEDRRIDYLNYLYDVAIGEDEELKRHILPIFNSWESAILDLEPQTEEEIDIVSEINSATIMLHYVKNSFFLRDKEILEPENIAKIKNMPIAILNGRYDMITPVVSAYELHKSLPDSKYEIITLSGHHGNEKPMNDLLTKYLKFDW